MDELIRFRYATIVCDGCGKKADSSDDDEILMDIEDLEYDLEEKCGWKRQPGDKWLCSACAENPAHRTDPGKGCTTLESTILYGLRCDNCGTQWRDTNIGYTGFMDRRDTIYSAEDYDWMELGGKMLCPGCYKNCENAQEEDDAIREEKCQKCQFEKDCAERVPREVTEVSDECLLVVLPDGCKGMCPHYVRNPLPMCTTKGPCPRVEWWKEEREAIKKRNEDIKAWAAEDQGKHKDQK